MSFIKSFFLNLPWVKQISERNKAIRAAKRVALEINESYLREVGKIYGPPIKPGQHYTAIPRYQFGKPAENLITGILYRYGLELVDESEPHDLKITVNINGRCIPKLYIWPGGRSSPVYSGANVWGQFLLKPPNHYKYQFVFSGTKEPPQSMRNPGYATQPVYAPFNTAFENSNFKSNLNKTFKKFFG